MNTLSCKQAEPDNLYIMRNNFGMEAVFTTNDARLMYIKVPDKNGNQTNIALSFDRVQQYAQLTEPSIGTTAGFNGSRIAEEAFTLNGKGYRLATNKSPNFMRRKAPQFQSEKWKVIWPDKQTIIFTHRSENGEDGNPANLTVVVSYALTDNNELKIEYKTNIEQPIAINLANHIFFNLNGEGSGSVIRHLLLINADHYMPVDSSLVPIGKTETVKGTPFNFTKPTTIGARINDNNMQLKNGKGYAHNFVLNRHSRKTPVAKVIGDKSGILMEVFTDQPGLQFYSGNFTQGRNSMCEDIENVFCTGFCLAARHLPGLPNKLGFESTTVRSGGNYSSTTIYRFTSKGQK